MTMKEYHDKMDELSIKLGELQVERDEIETSKLDDVEMKAALDAVDEKMSAIRTEKFKAQDEYNNQEEQKKEKLNKNRDDLIFKNELESYSKREKIKQEYVEKFPDSELTKDILLADKEVREGKVPSKKVDINKLIKALEEARKAEIKAAAESNDNKEQSNPVAGTDSDVNDDANTDTNDTNDYVESTDAAPVNAEQSESTDANVESNPELNKQAQKVITDDGKGKQNTKGVHTAGDNLKGILSSTAVKAGLVVGASIGVLALFVASPQLGLGALAVASGVVVKSEMNKGRKGR